MKRLGERIKKKRELYNIQLNDLAKRVGISASALSQIENAKSSPSIVTLKHIAECLNTTVGELVGENENLSQDPLVRFDEMRFLRANADGSRLFALSNHEPHKQMDNFLISFSEKSTIEGLFPLHRGQVFCRVSEGTFKFHLDEVEYELRKGDNFYFDNVLSHRVQLSEGTSGELLWIVTPPIS
jgi:transcriptional regulator with XRE-family HTH domain